MNDARNEQLTGDASEPETARAGEPELVILPDEAACAAEATERIARAVIAAVEERGRADFATTGGSTPIPIYRLLSQPPYRQSIPWQQLHVWWGDDRFVPRDHPESNVTSLDQVLIRAGAFSGQSGTGDAGTDVEAGTLAGVPLPPSNIHIWPTELALREQRDNDWCARRYAEEMSEALAVSDGNWPEFDLILLGVGDDGHCLSCFPHSPAFDSDAWALGVPAPTHIGPHVDRVTLNPRVLDHSRLLVVTWGEKKAQALGHVFGSARDERQWPVQRTRRAGSVWIVDETAAAQIPGDVRGGL